MTIAESYREYRGGKINKAQFMERARKDHHLKGLVTNVMSFQDTVRVLKNKGIISESIEEVGATVFTDKTPKSKIQRRANVLNRFKKDVEKAETEEEYQKIANVYKKMIDSFRKYNITPRELEQLLARTGKYDTIIDLVTGKGFHPPAKPEEPKPSVAVAAASARVSPELTDLLKQKDDIFAKFLSGELTLAQYKKEIGDIPQRIKALAGKSTTSNLIPLRKRAVNLRKEGVEIIPAEVRKGINFELGLTFQAIPDWDDSFVSLDQMKKAENKVMKNLEKDSLYYTKLLATGEKPKGDEPEGEIEYKESKVNDTTNKTKADGHLKKEVKKDEDSNVQTSLSKSEKKTGKPEGVKQLKEEFKPGVDLGASFDKMKSGMGAEEEFENLMKHYDWYYEMSDSDDVWQKGIEVDKKLKALADQIGVDKALEIYNRYAPKGTPDFPNSSRQVTSKFFGKENMEKLKETIRKHVEEAIKYSIGATGTDSEYRKTDDTDLENKLRKAGVSFTKKKIS